MISTPPVQSMSINYHPIVVVVYLTTNQRHLGYLSSGLSPDIYIYIYIYTRYIYIYPISPDNDVCLNSSVNSNNLLNVYYANSKSICNKITNIHILLSDHYDILWDLVDIIHTRIHTVKRLWLHCYAKKTSEKKCHHSRTNTAKVSKGQVKHHETLSFKVIPKGHAFVMRWIGLPDPNNIRNKQKFIKIACVEAKIHKSIAWGSFWPPLV